MSPHQKSFIPYEAASPSCSREVYQCEALEKVELQLVSALQGPRTAPPDYFLDWIVRLGRLVKKAVKMASNPEDDVSTVSVTIHQENPSYRRPLGIDDYVMHSAPCMWLFSQTLGPRSSDRPLGTRSNIRPRTGTSNAPTPTNTNHKVN